jgi:phage RecT family recombinase
MQAVLQSARMGLHLGTEAYLVPFTSKKTGITSATLITGYKGLIALAFRRHGIQVTHDIIRHGDVYTEDMGVVTSHRHTLTPGRTLAAYAIATHPSWSRPVGVLVTLSDVAKYKGSSNFWRDNADEMMSKTAVRKLFNRGFIPTEDVDMRALINLGDYDARPVNTSQRLTLEPAAPIAALPDLTETTPTASEEAF